MVMQATLRSYSTKHRPRRGARQGKILVLLAITLPTLCGMIGLVVDGSMLLSASQQVQHIADSAATAAAMEKQHGQSNAAALSVAEQVVHSQNGLASAAVTLNSPPLTGPYTGRPEYVELSLIDTTSTYFIHVLGGASIHEVSARAVAGFEPSTAGAAVMALDPNPPAFSTSPLPAFPLVPAMPAILGGVEILGVGASSVDGAVLVNTNWGGKDENGDQIGDSTGLLGLSHALSTTPLVGLTRLKARDIRAVGGVDDPARYGAFNASDPPPLKAGRLPVPDPFAGLPVPTTAADATNVKSTVFGGKMVTGLSLIGPPVTLQPGVYDWIEVNTGIVTFKPGVYIVRGVNPISQLALSVVAGKVQADGVMFYITNTTDYSPASGAPDSSDLETAAPLPGSGNITPAAVLNIGLLESSYSGLDDSGSPFNGMFIYQRRLDRRPIILVQENLIGSGTVRGTLYSKWGHIILSGKGTYDVRIVAGTVRLIALLDLQIRPSVLLPPAKDVFLVE